MNRLTLKNSFYEENGLRHLKNGGREIGLTIATIVQMRNGSLNYSSVIEMERADSRHILAYR